MRSSRVGAPVLASQLQVRRTGNFAVRAPATNVPAPGPLPLDLVLEGDCVATLRGLPEACVDFVFADPPYNLQLAGALSRPDQSLVDAVDDDWDKFADFATYVSFTRDWLTAARREMKPE